MPPEKLAANRANARRSQGPVTPEGVDQRRQANIRHRFYSREGDEALRILGEDPQEFRSYFRSLVITWQPADQFEERLVVRLANWTWVFQGGLRRPGSMRAKPECALESATGTARLSHHLNDCDK